MVCRPSFCDESETLLFNRVRCSAVTACLPATRMRCTCVAGQVDSLQYATLATVSRCGMVWFSASEEDRLGSGTSDNPGTVTNDMLLRHKVRRPCS